MELVYVALYVFLKLLRYLTISLTLPFAGFFCVLAGLWCIIIQILVYVFLRESKSVQIGITCVVAFSTLPFLQLLPSATSCDQKTASSA